jgi:hypothetical protein
LDLIAIDRIRTDADFEAVEIRGIVASRNHDPAAGLKMANREVENRCRAKTDVDNIHAGGSDSLAYDIMIALRAQTAIAAQGHLPDVSA